MRIKLYPIEYEIGFACHLVYDLVVRGVAIVVPSAWEHLTRCTHSPSPLTRPHMKPVSAAVTKAQQLR